MPDAPTEPSTDGVLAGCWLAVGKDPCEMFGEWK
jgi:hypothetical protein